MPGAVSQFALAPGDFGARQTLKKMRQLVNGSLVDPLVVETAKWVVADAGVNQLQQAYCIGRWMGEHWRFVQDPVDVELLHTPRYMLLAIQSSRAMAGDCDDAAILGAALGKAVGLRARFRALGFQGRSGPLTHVIADVRTPQGWVQLDVTRPAQFTRLPQIQRVVTVEV
jgi:hypothetical protein